MKAEDKVWLYNTIIVLSYLVAAPILIAVKGAGLGFLAGIAIPAPLVFWCALTNARRDKLFILMILVFSIVATPNLKIAGLPAMRAEQGIVLVVMGWGLYALLFRRKLELHVSLFSLMLAGLSLLILLSTTIGAVLGVRAIYSDLFELYKIMIYLGVFTVAATIAKSESDRWRVLDFASFSIAMSGLVAISQYFNPLNINKYYVQHIAPTQYATLVNDYFSPRAIGLSSNPNVFAFIAAIGVILSGILFKRTRRPRHLVFGTISLAALLMTKSRTGIIFLGVMLAVFFIIYFCQHVIAEGKLRVTYLRKMLIIFLGILLLIAVIFSVLPDSLIWRFKDIKDISSAGSWQARVEHWQENISFFLKSPILGIGSAKSIDFSYAPDNEWLLLLRKLGVLGTAWFVLCFALPIYVCWPKIKNTLEAKLFVSVLVGSTVYMLPAVVFHSFQLMPLVMIIAGLAFSALEDKRFVCSFREGGRKR